MSSHVGRFAVLALTLVACTGPDAPSGAHAALGSGPGPVPHASSFVDGTYQGRAYKVYVPSGYAAAPAPAPLVLMLHGCGQDPADFAAGTKMNTVAEANGFLVVYPDQPSSANANKCWNWFSTGDQVRGAGEPGELVALLDQVATDYQVDPARVFVAGLSAGAAMTVILGATYPDRFSAIAVASGLEYQAATSLIEASTALGSGGPDPVAQGTAAYNAMGASAHSVRVFVMHGTSDGTVAPVNGDQVVSQWAQTDDLASDGTDNDNVDDVADETGSGQVPSGRAYTVLRYKDSTTGLVAIQKLTVTGMGHAWSGGDAAGSYTDPKGPNASQLSWDFFMKKDDLPVNDGGVSDGAVPATDGSSPSGADAAMGGHNASGGCAMATSGPVGSAWWALVCLAIVCARMRRRSILRR